MIRNLVEEHVVAAYEQLRSHFPKFCGCAICKGDVLVYTLNRVPARYVNTLEGTVVTEFNLERDQSRAVIDVMLMEALQKVSVAPRCGRKAERA